MTPIRKTEYGILCKLDKPQKLGKGITVYAILIPAGISANGRESFICQLADGGGKPWVSFLGGVLDTTDPERAIQLLKEQGIE